MSRHNRERRRNTRKGDGKWRCLRCAAGMHANLAEAADSDFARASAGLGVKADRMVHVCGGCRAFHYAEGGTLRLLTPAEEFAVRCGPG